MKLKETPESFIVKEILPEHFIKSEGEFKVYVLVKKGVTTDHCLRVIAKRFGIKFSDIGFAGMKDKHALTIQYITLKGEGFRTNDFKLEFKGYSNVHLQRGGHKGNEFKITAKITEEERELMKSNESRVRQGFVNLFDTQRTGRELVHKSFTHYLLQGDYATALLRYYINKSKLSRKKLKLAYKDCFKQWPDLEKCYNILKGLEKNITLRPLREKDCLAAIRKIPKSELELLIAGHQALLWNQNPTPTMPVIKVPGFGIKTRRGKREVKLKPEDLMISYGVDEVIISFKLPKGSYATTLLKELLRKNL